MALKRDDVVAVRVVTSPLQVNPLHFFFRFRNTHFNIDVGKNLGKAYLLYRFSHS